jgi:hypothetical protein
MKGLQRLAVIRASIGRLQERLQWASDEQERNELRRALADAHAIACLAEEEIRLEAGGGDLAWEVRRWRLRAEEYHALADAAESDRAQSTCRHLADSYMRMAERAEARLRHRARE